MLLPHLADVVVERVARLGEAGGGEFGRAAVDPRQFQPQLQAG
jgi:hypothetical protein